MVQNYRDLIVWQKSMDLVDEILSLSAGFPKEQRFILCQQMERCAISIPSNIAEGRTRHSKNDFIYHLNIARGSLAELETQLTIAFRRHYLDELKHEAFLSKTREIMKMLHGLRDSIAVTSNLKPVTSNSG